eukprot:scaffold595527_cov40-Prasinocladus_malaysianus.AAC.1
MRSEQSLRAKDLIAAYICTQLDVKAVEILTGSLFLYGSDWGPPGGPKRLREDQEGGTDAVHH